jgi:hypothetical protein
MLFVPGIAIGISRLSLRGAHPERSAAQSKDSDEAMTDEKL